MRGSHKVIRHAYNNVLSASARLISFATGIPTASRDQLINERQGILAADDLITFAIHARRLIENTKSHEQFSKVFITAALGTEKLQVPITTIINKLIHHKYIKIVRFEHELWSYHNVERGDISEEDFLSLLKNKTHLSPYVHVESDRGKIALFELRRVIEIFETEVLRPIIEICSKEDLYLEDFDLES